MLRSIKNLIGYSIEANDGKVGKVKDALFDEEQWRLRYFVADTGSWLTDRQVLLTPTHIDRPTVGDLGENLPVHLTKKEIEKAPELDSDAPVSRRYEFQYAQYHQQDPYWIGASSWGPVGSTIYPLGVPMSEDEGQSKERERKFEEIEKCHLRSAHELLGYEINATDDTFGEVSDFIMEDSSWKFLYIVVDTRKWLPGKKFLIAIDWVKDFDWARQQATVSLSRDTIEKAPEYNPKQPVNRDYLNNLYDYYGKSRDESDLELANK